MTRAALALTLAACTAADPTPGPEQHWTLTARAAAPAGSELFPADDAAPGEAKPQSLAWTGEHVAVAHTNLRRNPTNGFYAPAGPSVVELLDPATLARVALVKLATADAACLNAGALLATNGRLVVACAGTFTDDGALAIVDLTTRTLERLIPTGGAPGSLAIQGDLVWAGDLGGGRLTSARLSGEVLHGRGGAAPVELCPSRSASDFPMIGDVAIANGVGWATCFSHDELLRFDPATGEITGTPVATGDGPLALVTTASGLFVLDNLGSTLTRVDGDRSTPAVLRLGQVPQDAASAGGLLVITNSGDGTATFVVEDTLEKVASVDLKRPAGGTPYPWGVTYGRDSTEVFVALNGTSEVVRLTRTDP